MTDTPIRPELETLCESFIRDWCARNGYPGGMEAVTFTGMAEFVKKLDAAAYQRGRAEGGMVEAADGCSGLGRPSCKAAECMFGLDKHLEPKRWSCAFTDQVIPNLIEGLTLLQPQLEQRGRAEERERLVKVVWNEMIDKDVALAAFVIAAIRQEPT